MATKPEPDQPQPRGTTVDIPSTSTYFSQILGYRNDPGVGTITGRDTAG